MSTPQPERLLRNAIMDMLIMWRVKCWVFDSVGIWDPNKRVYLGRSGKYKPKGLPDIHGVIPGGRFFGIEVKQPDKRDAKGKLIRYYPSQDQKNQIAEINAAGGLAFVARSLKDVKDRMSDFGVRHVGL